MSPESYPQPIKAGSPEELETLNRHLRRQEENDAPTNTSLARRRIQLYVAEHINELTPEEVNALLRGEKDI